MNYNTCEITINSEYNGKPSFKKYYVSSNNVDMAIQLANIVGLKYDSIKPSKLSVYQSIIRVYGIGELQEHLKIK